MSLKNDFEKIFVPTMTDDDFAKGIGEVIRSYVSSLTLTITPATLTGADSSPSGTFTGTGTASWSITGSTIESKIKSVLTSTMTDTQLAQAIAQALALDTPTFIVTLTGTTVIPGSPPVSAPSSDTGIVTAVFNSAVVQSTLNSCFNNMRNMTEGGDSYFAEVLAKAIKLYYTGASYTGMGATHLAGVQFSLIVSE